MKHLRNITLTVLIVALLTAFTSTQANVAPRLEVFSWLASQGVDEGLSTMMSEYTQSYPNIQLVNAAIAGGYGITAKAVLNTRMLGGNPPDTFQVHAGAELQSLWVAARRVENLNHLFNTNGWWGQFSQQLISMVSDPAGNVYAVPTNIHRSNVMWFAPANLATWGVSAPTTWNEFVTVTCPALQAQGITPLVVGETWTLSHLWESVALSVLGSSGYNGLWNGQTAWNSAVMQTVWSTFDSILDCANTDGEQMTWQTVVERVMNGEGAFTVMGDWTVSYVEHVMNLEARTDYDWVASPGTAGVFMMSVDSFALPVAANNPSAALNWLNEIGLAQTQASVSEMTGTLPANMNALNHMTIEPASYLESALNDLRSQVVVGSQRHGAVAPQNFEAGFMNIVTEYSVLRDVNQAINQSTALALQNDLGVR